MRRSDLARVARGRAGAPLRWGYTAVSEVEILWATGLGWVRGRLRGQTSRSVPGLTVIAKTFERPANAHRMVSSIRRVFDGPIVVADDSRAPQAFDDPGVALGSVSDVHPARLNTAKVAATPDARCNNARRSKPVRRAAASTRATISAATARSFAVGGRGTNSPFDASAG